MIAAIIPARGGSRRIRDKNIRHFDGKPMIAYSIEAARASGLFDRVIVDTDSEVVAEISRKWGAEVPYTRPSELAGDHVGISDVMSNAVKWLKANGGCDEFCCIYATAPFLTSQNLLASHKLMLEKRAAAVISVTASPFPIQRALRISTDECLEMFWPENENKRSQDLEVAYHDAGQFFWANADSFIGTAGIWRMRPLAFLLDPWLVHDINTPKDWEWAELQFRSFKTLLSGAGRVVNDFPGRCSRIVLGTAQLGMPYGIHNWTGRPSASEGIAMMHEARIGEIGFIDTAQAYGSAEQFLGKYMSQYEGASNLRILTKLGPAIDYHDRQAVEGAVRRSIERLAVDRLWGLLLHREEMLNEMDGVLGNTLRGLMEKGLVANLGASVYTPEYARLAIESPHIGIIEIPASVFDRRMVRAGVVELAATHGKVLFVRSIFAQGLVFMNPHRVPSAIPFGGKATTCLKRFCEEKQMEVRDFAYDYVRNCFPEAFIIIGAETAAQVSEICGLDRRPLLGAKLEEEWDRIWPEDPVGLSDLRSWRLPRTHTFKKELFRRLNGIITGTS